MLTPDVRQFYEELVARKANGDKAATDITIIQVTSTSLAVEDSMNPDQQALELGDAI